MPDPTPDGSPARRWKPLEATQRRVLGVLIEKAKTTPAGYPMSVNAIVAGCNQKSNRDPFMTLDDFGVEKAIDQLRTLGAVSEIDWLGRVSKFKHHAYEWLGVSSPEMAVMAELLLRGAQALGELRARAGRMAPIADLAALRPIVAALVERGLMVELTPPGRGQIVSHNLYLEPELAALKAHWAGEEPRAASIGREEPASRNPGAPETRAATSGSADLVAGLAAEIAELRSEVARLRGLVGNLEARLNAPRG